MTTSVMGDDRYTVPFILLAQVLFSAVTAVICGFWLGRTIGFSILLGGLAAFAPNAFFAARLQKAEIGSLMRSVWIGEIGKIVLTVLLCGAVFAFVRPISAPAFVGGLIATHLTMLPALLLWQYGGNKATTTS